MIYMKKLTAQALVLAGIWYVVWAILVFPLDIEAWVRKWAGLPENLVRNSEAIRQFVRCTIQKNFPPLG